MIRDEKKFTLLHYAAFHNQLNSAMVVIRHYQSYLKAEKGARVKEYINLQTDDGFTAIHFASYRGNTELVQFLESFGGNLYQTNAHGMNIMHIGAQGNQPVSIIFAAERGIKITTLDNKAGTPLHWAAFYGCEQSVIYLLSMIPDTPPYYPLNHLDLQHFTPLHLAVLSGNSRVVKKLLIAGADKRIVGKNSQTAAQLAQENEFYNIQAMIEGKQRWIVSYYNLKSKVQKIRRTTLNLLRFAVLILFQIGTFVLFCFRKYNLATLIVSAISLLLFLRLSCSDPGYQKRRPEKLLTLLEKFPAQEICPVCNTFRFKRTKHCDICQKCVFVYDHHCPWINNCVILYPFSYTR